MDLRIDFQSGLIGLNISPASFRLHQQQPRLDLKIDQPAVILDITHPSVLIDQREQFDQLGYRFPLSMAKYYGQKGQNIALRGIMRRVTEGNMLANIHKNTNAAQITAGREQKPRSRQITVEALPRTRLEIDVITEDIEVSLKKGEVTGWLRGGLTDLTSETGKVEVYLRQRPDLKITYAGKPVDIRI